MNLLRNSRTLKALTDNTRLSFDNAEELIEAVHVAIVANEADMQTTAGQAAALTAMVAARKTFRNVSFVYAGDAPLKRSLLHATSLAQAAGLLGVPVVPQVEPSVTHAVVIGTPALCSSVFEAHCWWDGWCSGVRTKFDNEPVGASWFPLAGAFAAAQAVREVFAQVRAKRGAIPRSSSVSLWEPWTTFDRAQAGPEDVYLPKDIALVGLGHLGQGFLWNLLLLPGHGERMLICDYQYTGEENVGTGVLTFAEDLDLRKTRVANKWLEFYGWKTALVEQKFTSNQKWHAENPPLIISALDHPQPREWILAAGYPQMLDLGVGHGATDFEYGQLRFLPKGATSSWKSGTEEKRVDELLRRPAYAQLRDQCGAFTLASSSVAVPYVGLALGALAVAQLLRTAALESTPSIMQLELSAPDMISAGALAPATDQSLGSTAIFLVGAPQRTALPLAPETPAPATTE